MKTAVIRKAQFNSAHRLHNAAFSEAENQRIFGLCNLPNYHGHNYTLEVKLIGDIDPQTGFVYDLGLLKDIIDEEVIEAFDHKNLNLDTAEFATLHPTAEHNAVVIYNKLRARIESAYEIKLKLYETERNMVEYPC